MSKHGLVQGARRISYVQGPVTEDIIQDSHDSKYPKLFVDKSIVLPNITELMEEFSSAVDSRLALFSNGIFVSSMSRLSGSTTLDERGFVSSFLDKRRPNKYDYDEQSTSTKDQEQEITNGETEVILAPSLSKHYHRNFYDTVVLREKLFEPTTGIDRSAMVLRSFVPTTAPVIIIKGPTVLIEEEIIPPDKDSDNVFRKQIGPSTFMLSEDNIQRAWLMEQSGLDASGEMKRINFGDIFISVNSLCFMRSVTELFVAPCGAFFYKELKLFQEICKNCNHSNVLNHYRQSTVFHRILNYILRQQRNDFIYPFQHIIMDLMRSLSRPLPSEDDSVLLKLYRGQQMTIFEVEELKHKVGEIVYNLPFLSTSMNQQVATTFAGNSFNDKPYLVSVIFEIDLDTGQPLPPYALVNNSAEEEEVLLSPYTKFVLISCRKLHENGLLWHFKLKAISEERQEQIKQMNGQTFSPATQTKKQEMADIGRGCSLPSHLMRPLSKVETGFEILPITFLIVFCT